MQPFTPAETATPALPRAIAELRSHYRSGSDDLAGDFFKPCLTHCVTYSRAVGYFSSSALATWSHILPEIARGGRKVTIRLLVSPALSENDREALRSAATDEDRRNLLQRAGDRAVLDALQFAREPENLPLRLRLLAWMIAAGHLEIRFAYRNDLDQPGLFHEKIGIFSFPGSATVAFTGSANESLSGHSLNYETLDVFRNWVDEDQLRVTVKEQQFEESWVGRAKGLAVLRLTPQALERVRSIAPTQRPTPKDQVPSTTSTVVLRDYQTQLVDDWISHGYQGIIALATGCGKTITALSAIERLASTDTLAAVVIVCPYRHLVTQWVEEARRFGLAPLVAMESRTEWQPVLADELFNTSQHRLLSVVTTYATFAGRPFQGLLERFPARSLAIVDEVHNVGASHLRRALPARFPFRLGLSATPERAFDPVGTDAIFDYFGDTLEPVIGIREAIAHGLLTPYNYYPVVIELEEDEAEEYNALSRQLAAFLDPQLPLNDNPRASALLAQRARLIGAARGKLPALRRLVEDGALEGPSLVYCGDGTVDDPEVTDAERRQIDAVTRLIGHELGIPVARYTAETSTARRRELRAQLGEGEMKALVAIRCLDEGVDIPAVETAVILASSTNPRQFIQRRGRVLRVSRNKSYAKIYDMLVAPPSAMATTEAERHLFRRELARFTEFAQSAMNHGSALEAVLDTKRRLGLLDL